MAPEPEFFYGGRGRLQYFLTQVKLYLRLYESEFDLEEEKVLFAMKHLRGSALALFTPYIEDFCENLPADRKATTTEIFGDFSRFEEELERFYGDHGKCR